MAIAVEKAILLANSRLRIADGLWSSIITLLAAHISSNIVDLDGEGISRDVRSHTLSNTKHGIQKLHTFDHFLVHKPKPSQLERNRSVDVVLRMEVCVV